MITDAMSTTQDDKTRSGQIVRDQTGRLGVVMTDDHDTGRLDVAWVSGDTAAATDVGDCVVSVHASVVEVVTSADIRDLSDVVHVLQLVLLEKVEQAASALNLAREHEDDSARLRSDHLDEIADILRAHSDEKARMRSRIVDQWAGRDGGSICTAGLRRFLREFHMDDVLVVRQMTVTFNVAVPAESEHQAEELLHAARTVIEVRVDHEDDSVEAEIDHGSVRITVGSTD
ncbi:MAG: hypothetical protein ACT4NY_09160 [Pseudonocardiales bacterium]